MKLFDLPPLFGSRTLTGVVLGLSMVVGLTIAITVIILTSGDSDGDQAISWGERALAATAAYIAGQQWREAKR